MDYSKKQITHISMCAGFGGIDIGLKRAIGNLVTVAYVEIEDYAVVNLLSKIEQGFMDFAPIWTDLHTFPYKKFFGKVDILSAGFPCQPFSTAGERKSDNDPRHLFPSIAKGIKQCKPTFVFLENVTGIITAKTKENKSVLLHVLQELERLDYAPTFGIFSARECGGNHNRQRIFILAVSNDLTNETANIFNKNLQNNKSNTFFEKYFDSNFKSAYPRFRNENQGSFEPKQIILSDSTSFRLQRFKEQKVNFKTNEKKKNGVYRKRFNTRFKIKNLSNKFKLSRNLNGPTHRLDFIRCRKSSIYGTERLKLLGNGVFPDTAKKAFLTLWSQLYYES